MMQMIQMTRRQNAVRIAVDFIVVSVACCSAVNAQECLDFFEEDKVFTGFGHPSRLILEDFSGDGLLDMATSNEFGFSDFGMTVRFGIGEQFSGSFVFYDAMLGPDGLSDITSHDLDGDGDIDILAAGADVGLIRLFVNDGEGVFSLGGTVGDPGGPIDRLAKGDIDGDGDIDFVAAASNEFVVFVNDGNGGLSAGAPAQSTCGTSDQTQLALSDFDGDGDLDLALSGLNCFAGGAVSILLNDGSGVFGSEASFSVPPAPTELHAVDFDGDGDVDLVTVHDDRLDVTLLVNDGNGAFSTTRSIGVQGNSDEEVSSIAIADYGNDGDMDIVVQLYDNGPGIPFFPLFLLESDGNGAFQQQLMLTFSVGGFIDLEFLNSDGQFDVVVDGTGIYMSDCPAGCAADIDDSGTVDFTDVVLLLNAWGPCDGCDADVDGVNGVGFGDLVLVLNGWGPC